VPEELVEAADRQHGLVDRYLQILVPGQYLLAMFGSQ